MEINKKELENIYDLIDEEARGLVGILMKRLEILEKQENLSLSQLKSLYKSLIKENVYEQSRVLKQLITVSITPQIKHRTKEE